MNKTTSSQNPENLRKIHRSIAALVIISSDGKILMGKKDPSKGGVYPNAWHIPGGGVEDGETLEAAARREGLEEVGIDLSNATLTPLKHIGLGETSKVLPSGEKVWVKMTFNRFEVRLPELADEIEAHANDDLVELHWFSPDELSSAEQIPGGKEFFEQAGYIKNHN